MADPSEPTNKQLPSTPLVAPRLGIEYLPHQETGIRWMLAREQADAPVCRGGILGDDMGLGKTFQTIGLLKNSPTPLRTLIICPPALMAGWTDELRACGYFVSTLMQSSAWAPVPEGADGVWLTTYPKASLYRVSIATAEPAFGRIILDEGHVIRNGRNTNRWLHCMAIAKRAETRWILSATPVQNSYSDWRNLCWWLRVKCPAQDIPDLGPVVMLRRTMSELRDQISALPAPPRFHQHDFHIPVGSEEGKLFRALCDQLKTAMDSTAVSSLIKLELYLRIQQFLVHPQVYIESMRAKFKGAYPRPDWTATATKWDAVMTELDKSVATATGTIVFCNFKAEIDRVVAAAEKKGASVFAVRGGMSAEAIGGAVTKARELVGEGKPVVFVVQIVSGGAGLNLQFCQKILFLSQHWNPAVVHQAVGRAVRIGQKAVVDVHMYRVVDDVFDNIDRRMINAHLRKIESAKEICGSLYEGYAPLEAIPTVHEDGMAPPDVSSLLDEPVEEEELTVEDEDEPGN